MTALARPQHTRPDWHLPALLFAVVVTFFLWKGLPAPDLDDLFFLGAPLHLAEAGELANPLLRRWAAGFGTERYFLQMPLHPHLLAVWLWIFGVNVPAVLGFSWACYGVGALGLGAFLRRFGWGTADVFRLLPIYLTLMVWLGQRPDVAAFALLFAGLGLLDPRRSGTGAFGRAVAGFTLTGMSLLCYPMTLFWGGALVLADVARVNAEERWPWSRTVRAWLPALAVAVVLVAGLFVALVRGEVQEFLRVFSAHRALRAREVIPGLVQSGLKLNKESLLWPVLALFPVLAAWAALGRGLPLRVRLLVLGAFAAAVIGVLTYYARNAKLGMVLGFAISGIALANMFASPGRRTWARAGVAVAFTVAVVLWLVQTALQHPPDPVNLAAARSRFEAAAPGRTPFVDAAAARYLFHYRLPPGAVDLLYAEPAPGGGAVYRPEEAVLWAGARPWRRYLSDVPPALAAYPVHTLRGRPVDTLPLNPFEIVVLPDR